ncbi:response regulator [Haloarchaeobius amylolyticus]|uniref:response regulator n=1 Tax=Haloarchaeobius amylolyticus TaxID=1198296 RepID=UPI00226E0386|nr:response regulator [Haloarchaeobius amylolyticus]
MSRPTVRLLHVDDDPAFTELVGTVLEKTDDSLEITSVTSPTSALSMLEEDSPDCIVSDYDMPEMNGLALLREVREREAEIPFVLFTGKGSEEVASEAISAGVSDYLQKSGGLEKYEILANRVRNLVEKYHAERRSRQLMAAIESVGQGVSLLNPAGEFVFANDAYATCFGYEPDELVGEHWSLLYETDADIEHMHGVVESIPENGYWTGQTRQVRKDQSKVLLNHQLAFAQDRTMICTVGEPRDAAGSEPIVVDGQVFDEDSPAGVPQ